MSIREPRHRQGRAPLRHAGRRRGTACSSPSSHSGAGRGSPASATSRAASRLPAASDTCCPSTVRSASSAPSTWPGTRRPGRARTSGPSTGSAPSAASTATGSQSASSSRRHRSIAAGTSRRSSTRTTHGTWRTGPSAADRRGRATGRPAACRGRAGGAGCGRTTPARSPRPRERRAGAGRATAPRRRTASGPGSVRRAGPHPVTGTAPTRPRRSAVGVAAYTSRMVSLNCRTLENPAAKATSSTRQSVVSSSSRAFWARWARARATGPAPSSAVSRRVRWRGE